MSHTCSIYKHLVPEFFQRKRQCGWIQIIGKDGMLKFSNYDHFHQKKEKYEIIFRSLICNVEINWKLVPIMDIFKSIKDNCSKTIKSLVFDSCICGTCGGEIIQIDESHMELIGEQIKQLELLSLGKKIVCNIQWDRFENLQVLFDEAKGNYMWLHQKFPNLHTLHFLEFNEDLDVLANFSEIICNSKRSAAGIGKCFNPFCRQTPIYRVLCFHSADGESMIQSTQWKNVTIKLNHMIYVSGSCMIWIRWMSSPKWKRLRDFILIVMILWKWSSHSMAGHTNNSNQTEYVSSCENISKFNRTMDCVSIRWKTNDYVTVLIDGLPNLKHLYLLFMGGIKKKNQN